MKESNKETPLTWTELRQRVIKEEFISKLCKYGKKDRPRERKCGFIIQIFLKRETQKDAENYRGIHRSASHTTLN